MVEISELNVYVDQGEECLSIKTTMVTEDGLEHPHYFDVPSSVIASWSELLGIDDLTEVLEAILEAEDSEPDPVTGENNWTDTYMLLTYREQKREQEAKAALLEGTADDPRSPVLRASLAAYQSVHVPVDDGECAMDRCRRGLRERLKLPKEPSRKAGMMTRGRKHNPAISRSNDPRVEEVLGSLKERIEFQRRNFLHSLTGESENPLRDTTPPEAEYTVEEPDPFAATLRKYGAR